MATIKAFSAIRPVDKHMELEVISHRLEGTGFAQHSPSAVDYRGYMAELLASGRYKTEEPAIYLYGCDGADGRLCIGVWSLSSLQDVKNFKVLSHEQVLESAQQRIYAYQAEVGLQGSAVVLCYPGDFALSELIERASLPAVEECYLHGSTVHRIWKITGAKMIESFQQALAKLPKTYIADGHHRLAAAGRLHQQVPQWISTLYLAFDQVNIQAMHRLVRVRDVDRGALVRTIANCFYLSAIPDNKPLRPEKKGIIGMFLSGIWYRLELRPNQGDLFELPDAKHLQDKILGPGIGIAQPQKDDRLEYFNDSQGWNHLLSEIQKDNTVIAFTLYRIDAAELKACADLDIPLPPKSTSILPRAPYGLLIYDSKGEGEEK